MPTESSCSASDATELQELPPSAKLVAKTLEYEGTRTQSQLSESTLLPVRTVRSALRTLKENDIVTARLSTMDARQQVYSLNIEPN
ncbi:hypothetical protein [Halomicroarcula nitratireducens]|uniref:hypothetical protein n=1 Tax=Haloarcula nitratireducens TaxID=2487749 RepID=UPI001F2BA953